ncbi:Uncharacterized conserved protein [Ceraceosorus bombacis]|uniref:Uncharacterized conserved protein n=1 Tax=Ceraceosorus bombacis TaxID=401625 RepID=A0A0P1B7U0_9BASI|nr:Uncharacterized conserved protein [Ceraceosorus bombacis]
MSISPDSTGAAAPQSDDHAASPSSPVLHNETLASPASISNSSTNQHIHIPPASPRAPSVDLMADLEPELERQRLPRLHALSGHNPGPSNNWTLTSSQAPGGGVEDASVGAESASSMDHALAGPSSPTIHRSPGFARSVGLASAGGALGMDVGSGSPMTMPVRGSSNTSNRSPIAAASVNRRNPNASPSLTRVAAPHRSSPIQIRHSALSSPRSISQDSNQDDESFSNALGMHTGAAQGDQMSSSLGLITSPPRSREASATSPPPTVSGPGAPLGGQGESAPTQSTLNASFVDPHAYANTNEDSEGMQTLVPLRNVDDSASGKEPSNGMGLELGLSNPTPPGSPPASQRSTAQGVWRRDSSMSPSGRNLVTLAPLNGISSTGVTDPRSPVSPTAPGADDPERIVQVDDGEPRQLNSGRNAGPSGAGPSVTEMFRVMSRPSRPSSVVASDLPAGAVGDLAQTQEAGQAPAISFEHAASPIPPLPAPTPPLGTTYSSFGPSNANFPTQAIPGSFASTGAGTAAGAPPGTTPWATATGRRTRKYDFDMRRDCDAFGREMDEFYSYVEAPQFREHWEAFKEWIDLGSGAGAQEKAEKEGLDVPGEAEIHADVGTTRKDTIGSEMEWTSLPSSTRRRTLLQLLSELEVRDSLTRQRASRALLYLLQGNFRDTLGEEHQIQWMMENARMVRSLGGIEEITRALKNACWKHDWLSALPDEIRSSTESQSPNDAQAAEKDPNQAPSAPAVALADDGRRQPLMTHENKLDFLDEINLEIALHFAQLYILVETGRGEPELGDELMSLDPPLPVFLFGLVASLRDKNAKGYPVKKLLLLLWKTLLAALGGDADIERCKMLARQLEGLPPKKNVDEASGERNTKATPLDMKAFHEEITNKFPTYESTRRPDELPLDKIATAVNPIPARKMFGHHDTNANGAQANAQGGPGNAQGQPGTPAPTPPASPGPKVGKQKYQTDQNRPFVFPFSRSVQGGKMVPKSIEEAAQLYKEHMTVGLDMWQTWRLREQVLHDESGVAIGADGKRIGVGVGGARAGNGQTLGIESGPNAYGEFKHSYGSILSPIARRGDLTMDDAASSSQGSRSPSTTEAPLSYTTERRKARNGSTMSSGGPFSVRGEPTAERLHELEMELEAELARVEGDHMLAVLDNPKYVSLCNTLAQQRLDARRLQRVDLIYRNAIQHLHPTAIVLLKLLLATVTQQSSTNSPHSQAVAEGISPEEAPPPTLEDIDIVRHREITSKAVSAIILLIMRWFKTSHAMKFHYFSQLLVDSNSLLLILKMFGLQETANTVRAINEAPNFKFFKYCELYCGKEERLHQPEDTYPDPLYGVGAAGRTTNSPPPPGGIAALPLRGDEVELMREYSFRNFSCAVNFLRVLQKLTKRKTHRVLMMVQYKSSNQLKRVLKIPHPGVQKYVLKMLKSQVPFCGRKWRQANMKVITAIYLHLRPDLREEWLSGADIDQDVEESLPQEQACRNLVKFYNLTRFGNGGPLAAGGHGHGHAHRRSLSTGVPEGGLGGPHGPPLPGASAAPHHPNSGQQGPAQATPGLSSPSRSLAGFFDTDLHLPPLRRRTESTAGTLRYIPDDLLDGYLDEYEDVLGELFGFPDAAAIGAGGMEQESGTSIESGAESEESAWRDDRWALNQSGAENAWARLGEILGDTESISDSESINLGDLGSESSASTTDLAKGAMEGEGEMHMPPPPEGAQSWEHLSPREMRVLTSPRPTTPGSPGARRRRHSRSSSTESSGSPARPTGQIRRSSSSGLAHASSEDGAAAALLRPNAQRAVRSNSDSSQLRPVLSFGPELLEDDQDEEEEEVGEEEEYVDEIPRPNPQPGGIDEVEHLWSE